MPDRAREDSAFSTFFYIRLIVSATGRRLTERERDERKAKQYADTAATLRT